MNGHPPPTACVRQTASASNGCNSNGQQHHGDEKKAEMPASMYDWRVHYLLTDLKLMGKEFGPLQMVDFEDGTAEDHFHYGAVATINKMLEGLGRVNASAHILDAGSGVGGPARHMCWRKGCRVTGIDLQESLCSLATELTHRCCLQDKVSFRCGDLCRMDLGVGIYDHVISSLTILHTTKADRSAVISNLFRAMKPGGTLCIEDYISVGDLTEDDKKILRDVVGVPYLPSDDVYQQQIADAGFVDVTVSEMTQQWAVYTKDRVDSLKATEQHHRDTYGVESYTQRRAFCEAVEGLFAGGHLGGIWITASKPLSVYDTDTRQHISDDVS
eukprot:GHVQ01031817.1.p1 GENE.GHVQ01031817.1~~GHVQ01031817.1.p1  ORF type:complete len:329 (+),score=62.95 GHVQ01031817.1:290-1276(+)